MPQSPLNFDALRAAVLNGARRGLDDGAEVLAAAAESGGDFQNQTSAERGGTVAYVPGISDGLFAQAVAIVEARNPGGVEVNAEHTDADAVVVLTSPTSYAAKLEIERGGAFANALAAEAGGLTQAMADGIKGVLGG